MANSDNEQSCPLKAVDQRLGDVHRHWHRAEQSYFVPDEFRINVQSAIHTLRTVTFVLQNNKRIIPDFENWYEPWRVRFGNDPLMRWAKDARNKIEKQGDLESKSFIRAEVIASYLENGPRVDIEASLFQGPSELLKGIPPEVLLKQIFRHGTLRIERRWIQNELPDYELLDAVAIAYGRISELLDDAHRQIGRNTPKTINCETGIRDTLPELRGRLPCMIGHDEPRALLLSLARGIELKVTQKSFKVDRAKSVAVSKGYETLEMKRSGFATVRELSQGYFEIARKVFTKDGHHRQFLFSLKGPDIIQVREIVVEDRQQKYLMIKDARKP